MNNDLINFAPQFKEEKNTVKIFLKDLNPSKTFAYQIPEYEDLNQNDTEGITLDVKGLNETFMTFNELNNVIYFRNLEDSKVGTYKLNITLKDHLRKSRTYEFFFLIIGEEKAVDTRFGDLIMQAFNRTEEESIQIE